MSWLTARLSTGAWIAAGAMANGLLGLHYLRADGGYAQRTHGNQAGGAVHLLGAMLALALGGWGLNAWNRNGVGPRLASITAIVVGVASFIVARHIILDGSDCACSGL